MAQLASLPGALSIFGTATSATSSRAYYTPSYQIALGSCRVSFLTGTALPWNPIRWRRRNFRAGIRAKKGLGFQLVNTKASSEAPPQATTLRGHPYILLYVTVSDPKWREEAYNEVVKAIRKGKGFAPLPPKDKLSPLVERKFVELMSKEVIRAMPFVLETPDMTNVNYKGTMGFHLNDKGPFTFGLQLHIDHQFLHFMMRRYELLEREAFRIDFTDEERKIVTQEGLIALVKDNAIVECSVRDYEAMKKAKTEGRKCLGSWEEAKKKGGHFLLANRYSFESRLPEGVELEIQWGMRLSDRNCWALLHPDLVQSGKVDLKALPVDDDDPITPTIKSILGAESFEETVSGVVDKVRSGYEGLMARLPFNNAKKAEEEVQKQEAESELDLIREMLTQHSGPKPKPEEEIAKSTQKPLEDGLPNIPDFINMLPPDTILKDILGPGLIQKMLTQPGTFQVYVSKPGEEPVRLKRKPLEDDVRGILNDFFGESKPDEPGTSKGSTPDSKAGTSKDSSRKPGTSGASPEKSSSPLEQPERSMNQSEEPEGSLERPETSRDSQGFERSGTSKDSRPESSKGSEESDKLGVSRGSTGKPEPSKGFGAPSQRARGKKKLRASRLKEPAKGQPETSRGLEESTAEGNQVVVNAENGKRSDGRVEKPEEEKVETAPEEENPGAAPEEEKSEIAPEEEKAGTALEEVKAETAPEEENAETAPAEESGNAKPEEEFRAAVERPPRKILRRKKEVIRSQNMQAPLPVPQTPPTPPPPPPPTPPPPQKTTLPVAWYVILDTNVYLEDGQLTALNVLIEAARNVCKVKEGGEESGGWWFDPQVENEDEEKVMRLVLVNPIAVVDELNGIKKTLDKRGKNARSALRLLAEAFRENEPWLRGQMEAETQPVEQSGRWTADNAILGCSCYFDKMVTPPGRVILLTADNALQVKALGSYNVDSMDAKTFMAKFLTAFRWQRTQSPSEKPVLESGSPYPRIWS